MKAVLLSLVTVVALTPPVQAGPRVPGSAHEMLLPLEQAATACFAETVAANPRSMAFARAGRWYEAASVTGFLCRPEVDAMVGAHDRLYGRGTGNRFFKNAYARHLGQQLADRLKPFLERTAVANAEPRDGAASDASGKGTDE
ncbi:hypothetical protein ASG40_11000 [Methylobacterium sp. Leaf399]|uniref:hypothetical protein n=1 Tax=unclassified Methylobacterium TaxID=2615210 RepID=UPI0006FEFEBE|nr:MULTISPECIES: hypothetical protein [unclassified Methylobacterium]KQP54939.1 hypothetical protein ASF39_04115 [Methylobacterium sp. Leaf108]KQT09164.1 hypothetical protein ASG40_11000 [Methylobacterium sp. Leaf399]KQT78910.1 hypothetical protein ASG59_07015 [Methylobacterium sp. Leaf466]